MPDLNLLNFRTSMYLALYDVQYDNVSNITEKCKKITVKE